MCFDGDLLSDRGEFWGAKCRSGRIGIQHGLVGSERIFEQHSGMAVFSAGCWHRDADGVMVDGTSTQPVMFHIAGVCHRDGIGVGLFCRRFAFFYSGGVTSKK